MKLKFIPPVLFVAVVGLVSSCIKFDISEKDYTCECTYVPNAGGANKVETSTVKGRVLEDAKVECFQLESKYMMQEYTGTCVIK